MKSPAPPARPAPDGRHDDPGPEGPEEGPRRGGPALEAMYGPTLWLIPTLERFPRRQKFLLGDRIQSTAVESLTEATFTRRRA